MSSPPARRARPAAPPIAPRGEPHASEPPGTAWVSGLAVLLAGATVYGRALGEFFSQDDFGWLARASGLLPHLTGPWRWLSQQVYWDLMRPLAGLSPAVYHATSLAAHLVASVLLGVWLARRLPAGPALVGSVFVATHAALFASVYWVSAIGDPAALAFACGVLLCADRGDRMRWAALPLFVLALLWKEAVITLPAVVMLASWARAARPPHGPDRGGSPLRDPLVISLLAVSVAFAAYLWGTDAVGARRVSEGAQQSAYSAGVGRHVLENALSYIGWTVNAWFPSVRGFGDARDPAVYPWAWAAIALAAVGLAWPRLRRHGFAHAVAAYLVLLLPVLPLRHHTYHYYLTVPMLGAGWVVASLLAALMPARSGGVAARNGKRTPWPGLAAALAVVLLTWNGALLVQRIATQPFAIPGLLSNSLTDRARIAAKVRDGLAGAPLAPGTRLAVWLPNGWAYPGAASTASAPDAIPYTRRNLRSALMDGVALRVLFPALVEVQVVDHFDRSRLDWLWALCRPDGSARALSGAELDSLLRTHGEPR